MVGNVSGIQTAFLFRCRRTAKRQVVNGWTTSGTAQTPPGSEVCWQSDDRNTPRFKEQSQNFAFQCVCSAKNFKNRTHERYQWREKKEHPKWSARSRYWRSTWTTNYFLLSGGSRPEQRHTENHNMTPSICSASTAIEQWSRDTVCGNA